VRSSLLCLAASLLACATVLAEDPLPEKTSMGSVLYLDSLNGFRGIKFGTAFSEFKDMTVDQDHGKLKLYTKKDEDLVLGLAKLGTIVYHFFDDKFYGVSVHTSDSANTQTLVAIAGTGFGQGAKLDKHNTIWQGETAWAQLSQNDRTGEGTLFIGNCELSRQLGEFEQQAAAAAAAQL
ncbi:MAG TPA: hypothetical protein VIT23_10350, partial [Terrimicrobiaceae bacterium]